MIKVKDTESKKTSPKRNITISGVSIVDNKFYDESGEIVEGVLDALPDPSTEFTIKISIELPDEDEN